MIHSVLFGADEIRKGNFNCVYGVLKGKNTDKEVHIDDALLAVHNDEFFNPYYEPQPNHLLRPGMKLDNIIGWYCSLQNMSLFCVGIHYNLQRFFQSQNKLAISIAIKPGNFLKKRKLYKMCEVYRLKDDLSDWDYKLDYEIIGADENSLFDTIKSKCQKIITDFDIIRENRLENYLNSRM